MSHSGGGQGKVALVTGGGRGIGRGVAVALGASGVDVAIAYRSRESEAADACREVEDAGSRCVAVRVDVSSAAEVARLVDRVESSLGPAQILVNNAGLATPGSLDEITEELWDRTIAVNLKSAFLVTQAVLPWMRATRWGRIINMSSVAAHVGGIVGPHYAASKAGMLGLTHSYAAHLAREGITVNAIAPALIATEMIRNNPQVDPDRIPVGRLGEVEDVCEAVMMLVRNGFITGQTIHVNGGAYMS